MSRVREVRVEAVQARSLRGGGHLQPPRLTRSSYSSGSVTRPAGSGMIP